MIHRFGAYELDEKRRELRLRGREVLLQPKVFDLIVYLVKNRDRVVGKEELLAAVWPGVVVTDGSLQRAVSLARAALRGEGAEDGIRTFPRQGYRFCPEVSASGEANGAVEDLPPALGEARRACEEGEWAAAAAAFAGADRQAPLVAADLERWAEASSFAGTPSVAVPILERAAAAHAAAGDPGGAARAALLLARNRFDRGEIAVAKGWLHRASTLLEKAGESPERGHLEWFAARLALYEGDYETCRRRGAAAREIGRRAEDVELELLGLVHEGHGLLATGQVQRGTAMHDEAAAGVLASGIKSWVGGFVYCSILWGCRGRGDWTRAGQWTDQFTRWCRDAGMDDYPGTCQLHRAEVLTIRGELDDAARAAGEACDRLSQVAPWAEGDAYRVLGDLKLERGDMEGAETAFRRAHELGWDPQPGLALVQEARGLAGSAILALERSLEDPSWANQERRGFLLAHIAMVASRAGEIDRAAAAIAELESRPELRSTASLEAVTERARADLCLVKGDPTGAVRALRRAITLWSEVGAPLKVAAARRHLAGVLAGSGDRPAAELELTAAEKVYRESRLDALLAVCGETRRSWPPDAR